MLDHQKCVGLIESFLLQTKHYWHFSHSILFESAKLDGALSYTQQAICSYTRKKGDYLASTTIASNKERSQTMERETVSLLMYTICDREREKKHNTWNCCIECEMVHKFIIIKVDVVIRKMAIMIPIQSGQINVVHCCLLTLSLSLSQCSLFVFSWTMCDSERSSKFISTSVIDVIKYFAMFICVVIYSHLHVLLVGDFFSGLLLNGVDDDDDNERTKKLIQWWRRDTRNKYEHQTKRETYIDNDFMRIVTWDDG